MNDTPPTRWQRILQNPVFDFLTSMVDRPGVLLRWLFFRWFAAIQFSDEDVERIRQTAQRGPIVYVLRTVSYLEFLYFNYVLAKYNLPLARFANGGVRTILLWPLHISLALLLRLWRLAKGQPPRAEEDVMAQHVLAGSSVLLFLRPPKQGWADPRAAKRVRGKFMETLVRLERQTVDHKLSLQLLPMTLLWGKLPLRPRGQPALAFLFGEPEAPGRLRAFLQFIRYRHTSVVHVAEPIDLRTFVATHLDRSDASLARMLRFETSGRIERERRAVLGPPVKSIRRVRREVLHAPEVRKAITQVAAEKQVDPAQIKRQAEGILRRMAASPQPWAILFLYRLMKWVFSRIYDGMDVEPAGLEAMRQAAKRGPLLLLPSHKSHIDYLVVSSLCYENGLPLPYIAAGANLSFFPLGAIFRRCNAFFIRRSFGDDVLYKAVFAAYVKRLVHDGCSIEFFIEGGRSRTGKLLPPKLGLLSVVAVAAKAGKAPDVQVVPIAIAYEKIVEEDSYAEELKGADKSAEDLGALLRVRRVLRSRYGRIDVRMGTPFSLAGMVDEVRARITQAQADAATIMDKDKQVIQRVAHVVTYGIAQASAVTPSALVAAACLATVSRGIAYTELLQRIRWLVTAAQNVGAGFAKVLRGGPGTINTAVRRALDLFATDGDIELRGVGEDLLIVVPDDHRARLEYYKNSAIHAFAEMAIVARAFQLSSTGGSAAKCAEVQNHAQTLSRLLKNELIYRPGMGFVAVFTTTLADLEILGWLSTRADDLVATDEGQRVLPILAGLLESTCMAYDFVARTLPLYPNLTQRELVHRLLAAGHRALLLGHLTRPEAITKPLLESAVRHYRLSA